MRDCFIDSNTHDDYAVYLSYGLYPLDSGAKLYSYGLCKAFSEYINLKIFVYSDESDHLDSVKLHNCDIFPYYCKNSNQKKYKYISYKLNSKFTGLFQPMEDYIKLVSPYIESEKCKYVIVDQIFMYEYFVYFKKKYSDKKFIYISHNAESVNYYEKNIKCKKTSLELIKRYCQYKIYNRNEKNIIEKSDYVFSICKDDVCWFKKQFGIHNNIYVCKPLIEFKQYKYSVAQFKYNIIFVGSMFWYPNVNGVIWFCENVFGELLKIDSRFTFYVVGKNPDSRLLKYKEKFGENFVLTGFVDSIESYYQMADIAIIPLFEGMGAKIKVLESIASGVPTIMTKLSANGYDITDESIIANTKEEYIKEIIKLRDDPKYRVQKQASQLELYRKYMFLDKEIKDILCE